MKIPAGFLVLVLLAGCLAAPVAPERLPFEFRLLNVAAESPEAEFTVEWRLNNQTGHTVYLWRCGDQPLFEVQRLAGQEWVNAGAAICTANLDHSPFPIEPGLTSGFSRVPGPGKYRLAIGFRILPGGDEAGLIISDPLDVP